MDPESESLRAARTMPIYEIEDDEPVRMADDEDVTLLGSEEDDFDGPQLMYLREAPTDDEAEEADAADEANAPPPPPTVEETESLEELHKSTGEICGASPFCPKIVTRALKDLSRLVRAQTGSRKRARKRSTRRSPIVRNTSRTRVTPASL